MRNKTIIATAALFAAMIFFPVNARAAMTDGQLFSAGAGATFEPSISDTVSEDAVLATAGESSHQSALEEKQINETIAGYTNLGIANVENHLNIRKAPDEKSDLVGKMTKNAGC